MNWKKSHSNSDAHFQKKFFFHDSHEVKDEEEGDDELATESARKEVERQLDRVLDFGTSQNFELLCNSTSYFGG